MGSNLEENGGQKIGVNLEDFGVIFGVFFSLLDVIGITGGFFWLIFMVINPVVTRVLVCFFELLTV